MMERVEAGWSDAQADCRRVFEENSHPMWVAEDLKLMDVNQAAHQMVARSTGQTDSSPKLTKSAISSVMAAMGRKGGKKGG